MLETGIQVTVSKTINLPLKVGVIADMNKYTLLVARSQARERKTRKDIGATAFGTPQQDCRVMVPVHVMRRSARS